MTRWNFFLPPQVLKFLNAEAKRTGLSKSELVRKALYSYYRIVETR